MLVFSMIAIAQVAASRGAAAGGSSTIPSPRNIVPPLSDLSSVPVTLT